MTSLLVVWLIVLAAAGLLALELRRRHVAGIRLESELRHFREPVRPRARATVVWAWTRRTVRHG